MLIIGLFFTGCGTVEKVALSTTAEIVADASYEMETESSWNHFSTATVPNLKFVDGLLYLDDTNPKLLFTILKGNTGYGFGVGESFILRAKLAGGDPSDHIFRTLVFYSRAIRAGLKILELQGIKFENLNQASRDGNLSELLDEKMSSDTDLEVIFYLAQALGASINLQKTSPLMISQLPLAKSLFDWVCSKKPDINYGGCDLFYGSYEAGRPAMLGGNISKGKMHFQTAIAKYPENFLARVLYITQYLMVVLDEEGYKEQKEFLIKAFKTMDKKQIWSPENPTLPKSRVDLFNGIAQRYFQIILRYEKDIF